MNSIKLFQSAKIRSVWNEEEQQWYFSVVDIVGALTDSVNPTDYLKNTKKRSRAWDLHMDKLSPSSNANSKR